MTNSIFAMDEAVVMQSLLQRLVGAFEQGGGEMEAVAAEIVDLGQRLRLQRGEAAGEVVSAWVERRNYRVPLGGLARLG